MTDNTKYQLEYKTIGTPTADRRATDITTLMKNLTLSTKVEDVPCGVVGPPQFHTQETSRHMCTQSHDIYIL